MRLPVSKVYRGFPELDRFTDEECGSLVGAAVKRHRRTAVGIMAAVLVIGAAMVDLAAIFFFNRIIPEMSDASVWALVLFFTIVATMGVALGFVTLWGRDVALRATIRRQIEDARCPECRYPLLGLAVADGRVICPECGEATSLGAMGLTEADVIGRSCAESQSGVNLDTESVRVQAPSGRA